VASEVRARSWWRAGTVVDALTDAARDVGADVVQANGEKMAIYAGRAAKRAGLPCVFRLHDSPFDSPRSFAVQLLMRLSPHDAVVTPSHWMADAFNRRWQIGASAIHNGIDLDRLPDAAADVRGESGWPSGTVVVGFFGRLQHWKGVDVFLRAVAAVAVDRPAVAALVVGGALYGREQEFADGLPRLASELGLGDRVRFTGHRDDALRLMAGCDVVVHASLEPEPLGMVVPEAMALGRAVIASRTGGPEEVVEDGVTGLLVPPGDAGTLASVLAALVDDERQRVDLGAAGRAAARDHWSAARMASEFADLYRSLAASS